MVAPGREGRCPGDRGSSGYAPAGYTLVEALIMAVCLAVVLLAVMMILETNHANYARGTARIDLQQNVRIGLDDFIRDVRLAGYGVPSATQPSVLPVFCNPCPAVGPFPACGAAGSTSPSAIAFMADMENASTTVIADATAGNSLRVASVAKFLQGGNPAPPPDYIFITDGVFWDAATVTGVNAGTQTITFTPNTVNKAYPPGYPRGSFVGRPRCIIYQLGVDPLTNRMVLQRNASDNRGLLTIAHNVQSLTLTYFDNNDVPILAANLPASIGIIRHISALLSGVVQPPGQGQQLFNVTSDIRPRNLR